MKTEREIWNMIDANMEYAKNEESEEEKEAAYNQIDALLWVLGDRSGKSLKGE